MQEWEIILTQRARENVRGPFLDKPSRTTTALVFALDADDAARRAQRVLPGWTAVLAQQRAPEAVAA